MSKYPEKELYAAAENDQEQDFIQNLRCLPGFPYSLTMGARRVLSQALCKAASSGMCVGPFRWVSQKLEPRHFSRVLSALSTEGEPPLIAVSAHDTRHPENAIQIFEIVFDKLKGSPKDLAEILLMQSHADPTHLISAFELMNRQTRPEVWKSMSKSAQALFLERLPERMEDISIAAGATFGMLRELFCPDDKTSVARGSDSVVVEKRAQQGFKPGM